MMNGREVSAEDARSVALSRPLHIETPLLRSRKLSEHLGSSVWLKMETMQNSGSFKVRGIGHLCQKVSHGGGGVIQGVASKLNTNFKGKMKKHFYALCWSHFCPQVTCTCSGPQKYH